MRLKFNRSLMIASRCCWLRRRRSRYSRCSEIRSPATPNKSKSAYPPMALSGVRSSWDIEARNALLALFGSFRLGNAARVFNCALLRCATFREIARDLGEANQLASRVAHRRNDHVRPEPRAILANTPALVFEASIARRDLELLVRLPARRDSPADRRWRNACPDLLDGIPVDPLGALVPARDVSAWIEHEDAVVTHTLNQQAESLFAQAQRFFRRAALRQIAGDLRESDRLAVGFRSAVMTTFAQKRDPSLRTRHPSSSTRPSAVAISSSFCGFRAAWSSAE